MKTRSTAMILAAGLCVASTAARAATPTAYLQYGGIASNGTTLLLSRVPVVNANGTTGYEDLTVVFSVSPAGVIGTAPTVTVKASPSLNTAHFQAGRYFARTPSTATVALGTLITGVGTGGHTVWTWQQDVSAPGSYAPAQATWQTGSPVPDIAARLAAAKVPSNPEYSFGYVPRASFYGRFYDNGLLAAEQVNGTITLISYSLGSSDEPSQVGTAILTKCADAACSNASK